MEYNYLENIVASVDRITSDVFMENYKISTINLKEVLCQKERKQ